MLVFLLFILILLNCYENVNSNKCGRGSICVPYHQCSEDPNEWENGKELIDIRFDKFNITYECEHYLDVCCSKNNVMSKYTGILDDRIGDNDNFDTEFDCGRSNIGGIDFKITGTTNGETQFGEFPWMIAIIKENLSNNKNHIDYICGGSLIHPSVVLTAAHSIIKFRNLTLIARAGEWDPRTDKEKFIHQDRKIKEIIIHNKYNKNFFHFDIALLITSKPFELLQHIRPVCLPSPQMDFSKKNCIAIGWGEDEYGKEDEYSVILKKLELPIIPSDICKKNLQKNSKLKSDLFKFHDSYICAGGIQGTKRNTCKGDGGSPLNCPIPEKKDLYYQSGIVSWGTGCSKNEPGVYTNIAYLRSWIDFVLAKRKLNFNNHNTCEGNQTCVPFYDCDGPPRNISCEDPMEICCLNTYILEDLSDSSENEIPATNFKWECGTRNDNILPFASTGIAKSIAEYGEFPWMIVILEARKSEIGTLNMYICGGSLIHPSVVLTAAHSVIELKVNNLLVRGGEWDTQTNDEIYPHQNRNVKELIIHDKYKAVFHYDIALLTLKTPFIMNINIIPICLPPPQMNFDNVRCIAIGHGKNKYGSDGKYATILQKISLSIIPSNICQNDINNKLSFKTSFKLHDSFICAGGADGTKTNTCKGDGGGPLICPIPGRKGSFYQAGIVSWGTGCDKEDIGIYTNVAYLRSWIDFVLAKRKLSYQFYTP